MSHRSPPPFALHPATFEELPAEVQLQILEKQEREARIAAARIERYGHVRAPIIVDHQGYKVAAIGNKLLWAKHWQTFHDLLYTNIAHVLGVEWGKAELEKPDADRHPIMQWYQDVRTYQRERTAKTGTSPYELIPTGPSVAYVLLAYDLYLLEHHALLRDLLVDRLKQRDQFQGARYEVYVAACFIRAGFDITLEDETDTDTSHCEFNATHRGTRTSYSVEAKSRHRPGYLGMGGQPVPLDQIKADVSRLIRGALRKRADYPRIIFTDINVPKEDREPFQSDWFFRIANQLKALEESQGDRPYPPAFVFFTNQPDHYVGGDDVSPGHTLVFSGLNMPEFRQEDGDNPVPAMERIAKQYPGVIALYQSIMSHQIPETLDW
ncbi:MAG: hypothetical protein ACREX3_18715 [Gammaproteobacteria bacterium]